jgi:hypothetical protein
MDTPPVGKPDSDGFRVTPKVRPIRATYYPDLKPKPPMARRMSLVERVKRALGVK